MVQIQIMGGGKALFGAALLVGFTWLLMLGLLEAGAGTSMADSSSIPKEKIAARPISDLNYMSKRRVPNGPDPIHNRRAGNSRRIPGQA